MAFLFKCQNKKWNIRLTHRILENHVPPPLTQKCVPYHKRRGNLHNHPACCYNQIKTPGKEISFSTTVNWTILGFFVQEARNRELPSRNKIQATLFSVLPAHSFGQKAVNSPSTWDPTDHCIVPDTEGQHIQECLRVKIKRFQIQRGPRLWCLRASRSGQTDGFSWINSCLTRTFQRTPKSFFFFKLLLMENLPKFLENCSSGALFSK